MLSVLRALPECVKSTISRLTIFSERILKLGALFALGLESFVLGINTSMGLTWARRTNMHLVHDLGSFEELGRIFHSRCRVQLRSLLNRCHGRSRMRAKVHAPAHRLMRLGEADTPPFAILTAGIELRTAFKSHDSRHPSFHTNYSSPQNGPRCWRQSKA